MRWVSHYLAVEFSGDTGRGRREGLPGRSTHPERIPSPCRECRCWRRNPSWHYLNAPGSCPLPGSAGRGGGNYWGRRCCHGASVIAEARRLRSLGFWPWRCGWNPMCLACWTPAFSGRNASRAVGASPCATACYFPTPSLWRIHQRSSSSGSRWRILPPARCLIPDTKQFKSIHIIIRIIFDDQPVGLNDQQQSA